MGWDVYYALTDIVNQDDTCIKINNLLCDSSMFDSIMESVSTRRSTLAEEDSREKEERRRRRAEERLPDNTSFLLPEDVTMTISHTQSGLLRRMLDKEREESLRYLA